MAEGLFTRWDDIDRQLTPTELVRNERPVSAVPNIAQETLPKEQSWFRYLFGMSDTSPYMPLLHALGGGAASHQMSLTPVFKMPDMWMMGSDHYKRIFAQTPKKLARFDVTPAAILPTPSGDHILIAAGREIFKISVVDGKGLVYSYHHTQQFFTIEHGFRGKFSRWHTNFTYAHLDGTFWECDYSKSMVSCYTEKLDLVVERKVKFHPMEVAILSGVMVVIEDISFDKNEILTFYKGKSTVPFRIFQLPSKNHTLRVSHRRNEIDIESKNHTLRVSHRRNEIYIGSDDKISVYSAQGRWLRDIEPPSRYILSFAVTDDGHLLICQIGKLSLWTLEGTFVCEWELIFQPNMVAVLPRGRGVVIAYIDGYVEIFCT